MDTSSQASLATLAGFIRKVQWVAVALAIAWLLSKLSSILTPFVIAAMLGWLVWQEIPSSWFYAGAVLIAGSGIYVALFHHREDKKAAP